MGVTDMFNPLMGLHISARQQRGVSMMEILVTLVIVSVGLLGLAGLQAMAKVAELESFQRAQALVLVSDMVEKIRLNKGTGMKNCFAITTAASGAPVYGTGAAAFALCTDARWDAAKTEWSNTLQGASETKTSGGVVASVGAVIDGRGCVTYDAAKETIDSASGLGISESGEFTVSVAWQGIGATVANTTNLCGTGLYGSETKRRVVSSVFRIANTIKNP